MKHAFQTWQFIGSLALQNCSLEMGGPYLPRADLPNAALGRVEALRAAH